ncbi:hypothetical protein OSB04_024312 [Centaurea solstitialis]|uniref:Uncharacterized protein n=1 Tax=Centaurea solstitialis TaxID=347529 RepID=A0AA38SKV1_9ASTR|nr:hypothetical protein OSB04_024312 [Centaurea solstitialis]
MYELGLTMNGATLEDRTDSEIGLKRKSAMECLFWLFEPSRISDLHNQSCEVVNEWRWFDKSRIDHVMNGDVELHFFPTEYQLADLFTEPLDEKRFNQLISKLGMLNPDA